MQMGHCSHIVATIMDPDVNMIMNQLWTMKKIVIMIKNRSNANKSTDITKKENCLIIFGHN